MKNIIAPIDKELILTELNQDTFLRETNAGGNSIYVVNAHNSPNVMREIGRLRELTFREAGGGTGEEIDIDHYDTDEVPFQQLVVWNKTAEEIVSAYRYILGKDVPLVNGYPDTPTSKLFKFSPQFIQNEWQDCIELGRSFVQPKYQGTTNPRMGLFSLDNIWDGLGALTIDFPDAKYFFGKMTMYNNYNRVARNMILNFLSEKFPGNPDLIEPFEPVEVEKNIFKNTLKNETIKDSLRLLNESIRGLKTSIPPLIKTYLALSSTMQSFGASANPEFGPVEEICIMINISDIHEDKKKRHIKTYIRRERKFEKKNDILPSKSKRLERQQLRKSKKQDKLQNKMNQPEFPNQSYDN